MKLQYKISLVVIASLIIMGILWYVSGMNRTGSKVVNKSEVQEEIKEFGYKINDNESTYYKNTFKELKNLLSNPDYDDNTYRDLVAKLFVIDLYSLGTKINKYEVSSIQYFHPDKQTMHQTKVIDNFYNMIEDNSYGKRSMELPIVSEVTIDEVLDTTYKLGDEEMPASEVDLTMAYEKNLGYDTYGKVTLVKVENKWWVVSFKGLKEKEEVSGD